MSILPRRRFLATVAATACATPARAASAPRVLRLTHLHTGERLEAAYFDAGSYQDDALAALAHLLRDFRSGETGRMDTALFDLLHQLQQRTGSRRPFEVISGFRSPATNRMLRERSSGVASGSLHLLGQAIDIRLADVPLAALRDAAWSMGRGGVGYYPGSNFVHINTGRVRRW